MEKFLIYLVLAGVCLFLPVRAADAAETGNDPFFDAEFAAFEEEMKAAVLYCWNLKTNVERKECEQKRDEKYENDVRDRGSKAANQERYGKLTLAGLDGKIRELKVLQRHAPAAEWKRKPGVVNRQILGFEISWLQHREILMQRAVACEERKKSLEKSGWPLSRLPPECQIYFDEKKVEEELKKKGIL